MTADAVRRGATRVAVACIAVAGLACGVLSPEEQLLTDFFEASRVYDSAVMSRMSARSMNPRTDGVVEAFEIARIEPSEGGREQVTIVAQLRRFDGRVLSRRLVFTMTRQQGRWFIEDFR